MTVFVQYCSSVECVLCVGGHWQALVGDRYGYRPFPSCIEAVEFEALMSVQGLSVDGVGTVRHWYQRDDNAATPCYLLQVSVNMRCYVRIDLLRA